MPKTNTININFLFFFLLFSLSLIAQSQINTHQTIKKPSPLVFSIDLKKHDVVKITVFNTTANVTMKFRFKQKNISLAKNQFCFAGQSVTLSLTSQWDTKALILIEAHAYELSYEITVNETVWKRVDNLVMDFLEGLFNYQKTLPAKKYDLRVSYKSDKVKQISMKFMDQDTTIHANKVNDVKVEVTQWAPFYNIRFFIQIDAYDQITDILFQVIIQLPNEMLNGCDGTNLYDHRIRACPIKSNQTLNHIQVQKFGEYPTFQLSTKSRTVIKLTMIEIQKWPEITAKEQLIIYLTDIQDQQKLRNITYREIKSNYIKNQKCLLQKPVCNFILQLEPGNYSVIPVLKANSMPILYLYERGDGSKVVQSFYSVPPVLSEQTDTLMQVGGMVQFVSHKQKLTEITFQCEDKFLLVHYMIFTRSKIFHQNGVYFMVPAQMKLDFAYNQDPNKAAIRFEADPNSFYLMIFLVVSQERYKESVKAQMITMANKTQDKLNEQISDEVINEEGQKNSTQQIIIDQTQDQSNGSKQTDQPNADDDDQISEIEDEQTDIFYQKNLITNKIRFQTSCLYTKNFQISIRNGNFPHKRLQELTISEIIKNKNQQSQNSTLQSLPENVVIAIGVIGGVLLLVVLVFLGFKIKARLSANNAEGKELVQENQTSSVNVESASGSTHTSIEITNIVNTEAQN